MSIIKMINKSKPDNLPEFADQRLVAEVAYAMSRKLQAKREQGYGGWWDKKQCSIDELKHRLVQQVELGNMVNAINFAGMIYLRELDEVEKEQ